MGNHAQAVPAGFHTLTPHLTVRNASDAIEFYKEAFGAEVLNVAYMPNGKIMHALLQLGDSRLMLNDEVPEFGSLSPLSTGGTGVTLHVYTEDVDAMYRRAISAGATVRIEPADQFWGDRYGILMDPYGFKWGLATHIKDLSPEEMQRAQDQAVAALALRKTA
jgi:PhnB protein